MPGAGVDLVCGGRVEDVGFGGRGVGDLKEKGCCGIGGLRMALGTEVEVLKGRVSVAGEGLLGGRDSRVTEAASSPRT